MASMVSKIDLSLFLSAAALSCWAGCGGDDASTMPSYDLESQVASLQERGALIESAAETLDGQFHELRLDELDAHGGLQFHPVMSGYAHALGAQSAALDPASLTQAELAAVLANAQALIDAIAELESRIKEFDHHPGYNDDELERMLEELERLQKELEEVYEGLREQGDSDVVMSTAQAHFFEGSITMGDAPAAYAEVLVAEAGQSIIYVDCGSDLVQAPVVEVRPLLGEFRKLATFAEPGRTRVEIDTSSSAWFAHSIYIPNLGLEMYTCLLAVERTSRARLRELNETQRQAAQAAVAAYIVAAEQTVSDLRAYAEQAPSPGLRSVAELYVHEQLAARAREPLYEHIASSGQVDLQLLARLRSQSLAQSATLQYLEKQTDNNDLSSFLNGMAQLMKNLHESEEEIIDNIQ